MALSNFTSKLNGRLIVVHLIGCWFFIYSFFILSYLHDREFLLSFLNYTEYGTRLPQNWHFDASKLTIFLLWNGSSKAIGLLTAFLISITIVIKKRWYWVNSLIVFSVAILLLRYNLFGWDYLKYIFLTPGSLFKEYSIGYFLTNGLVMFAIGLLLLFLKPVQQFIKPITASENPDEALPQDSDPQTDAINN
jgi:hypothetical protein